MTHLSLCLMLVLLLFSGCVQQTVQQEVPEIVYLPKPSYTSQTSVEEAMYERGSVREYLDEPLTLDEISQMLWAVQGANRKGSRTAPSAGALYPLEIYLAVGMVEGLKPGLYHYEQLNHSLRKISGEDLRTRLTAAAYGQSYIEKAPADLIIAAVYERTTVKYGEKGIRYVHMEAGHAAQNVYLQAVSLGLGTVSIGGFVGAEVKKVLGIAEEPLYIMPIGRKK